MCKFIKMNCMTFLLISFRSSGGPPVQLLGGEGGRAGGQGQSAKGKVMWPEMGTLEWLVCKQVRVWEERKRGGGRWEGGG